MPFPAELRVLGDTYKGKFTKLAGLQVRKIVCRSQEITPERTIYIAMWSLGGKRGKQESLLVQLKEKKLAKKKHCFGVETVFHSTVGGFIFGKG